VNLESLRQYCLSFPAATENIQWGADLVFKVGGKMFTVASTEPGETKVSFKCTPEEFAQLVEQDGIKPADYVARYHWVTLLRWDALPDREIRRLVRALDLDNRSPWDTVCNHCFREAAAAGLVEAKGRLFRKVVFTDMAAVESLRGQNDELRAARGAYLDAEPELTNAVIGDCLRTVADAYSPGLGD
jgi:predicted DNA-binding protein (MmcQ/YjbR family)